MERLRQSLDRSNGRRGATRSRERARKSGRKKTRARGTPRERQPFTRANSGARATRQRDPLATAVS